MKHILLKTMTLFLATSPLLGSDRAAARLERLTGHMTSDTQQCALLPAPADTGATRDSLRHTLSNPAIKQAIAKDVHTHRSMVGTIVQRQENHERDYYALYHAQPWHFRVLQDFLALVYTWETGRPVPPEFSFLRWWHTSPKQLTVQKYVDSHNGNVPDDGKKDISDALLSVNFSLFGNALNSGSSTFSYFLENRSSSIDRSRVQEVLDAIMDYYGFNKTYSKAFITASEKIATKEGSIVQILVPKTDAAGKQLIDDCLYMSYGRGVPATKYTYANGTVIAADDICSKKSRYIRSSGVLKARTEKKNAIDPIVYNDMQGRLYLSSHGVLNPTSGIKIYRYNTSPADVMSEYKNTVEALFKKMVAEKETHTSAPKSRL